MDPHLDFVLRNLAIYFFMFEAILIFGNNQLSQLNSAVIVLLLLISNAVQNAMVGSNVSLQGGLVAALVLFGANYVVKKIIFKNPRIKSLVESDPVILINDGIVDNVKIKEQQGSFDEL